MTKFSRRRFLEAAATLAAVAPLSGVDARGLPLDGAAMAAALASGRTTGAALVEAAIDRLERVNPKINAVSFKDYDRARALAASKPGGPLAGIPTLVKELAAQKGLPWTQGARAYKDRIADKDAPIVTVMMEAGLVPIGRSTSPEFGLTATGEGLLNGPTRNPWNLDHSSGGSSSGSGAAVAAGVVPFAHSSDGGGSIRIPASCNGLVGLKPSRGRTRDAVKLTKLVNISVNNCVSRTVRDTAAWFAAIEATGPDANYPPIGLVTGPSGQKLRITAAAINSIGLSPDAEVHAVFETASRLLSRLGHKVTDGRPNWDGAAVNDAFLTLWGFGANAEVQAASKYLGRPAGPDDLEPLTFTMASMGTKGGDAGLAKSLAALTELQRRYLSQFEATDIFMTPVLGMPPARIGEFAPTVPYEQMAERLGAYVSYTPIENVVGATAISLPIGSSRSGLPIGIQFATKPGGERVLLELAYSLERELEWYRRKPPLWVGG